MWMLSVLMVSLTLVFPGSLFGEFGIEGDVEYSFDIPAEIEKDVMSGFFTENKGQWDEDI